MMRITKQAQALAARTENAYSANRYNSWAAVAQVLLDDGYSECEAEAILRSKWTRWAASASSASYGNVPASALLAWLQYSFPGRRARTAEVKALVAATFTE
jgi:hypothetical protein